jgi:hypothetical protein
MKQQFSQDYDVDERYKAGRGAIDNQAGKQFLMSYLNRRSDALAPNLTDQRSGDNRFIFAGPGSSVYGFRNSFVPSK